MKKIFVVASCLAIICGPASAQTNQGAGSSNNSSATSDSMSKDKMKSGTTGMSKDGMSKNGMSKDGMSKDGKSGGMMKKDSEKGMAK